MERKAAQEFVSRWVPNFTPEFRRFLAAHLGRDSGVFTSGIFTFGNSRGCLAEHAGRFHPRTRSAQQPGVAFLRLMGLENGDSQIIGEWDRPRSENERREFEQELRNLLLIGGSWSSVRTGAGRTIPYPPNFPDFPRASVPRAPTIAEELDALGASFVAAMMPVVATLDLSIIHALYVVLRAVSDDVAAILDGLGRRVVGDQQVAGIHVHEQAVESLPVDHHDSRCDMATFEPDNECHNQPGETPEEAVFQKVPSCRAHKRSHADDCGEQEHLDIARRQCRRPQLERDPSSRVPNMRGVPVRADRKSAVKSWTADSERLATAKSAHHSGTKAEFMPLQAGRGSFDAKRVADRGAL